MVSLRLGSRCTRHTWPTPWLFMTMTSTGRVFSMSFTKTVSETYCLPMFFLL